MFCGIFDGHGPWGHFVAKSVRKAMPPSLLCNWQETLTQTTSPDPHLDIDIEVEKRQHIFDTWKHSYLKTCAAIDRELEQHRKINSFYSGTTALSIVRQVLHDTPFSFRLRDCRVIRLHWCVTYASHTLP